MQICCHLFITLSLNIARGQNKLQFKSLANNPCSSPLWESTHALWTMVSATCLLPRLTNKLQFKSTANSPCSSPLWESTHALWTMVSATCLLPHTGVLRKSYSCFDAGSGSRIICVLILCVKRFNISEDSLSDQEIGKITYLSRCIQTRI